MNLAPSPIRLPLRRALDFRLLILYGIGVTVGAGIYALVGKIAGVAGHLAPLSFLLAALVATPTALSFAELSSRLPTSAGEATYVRAGLRLPGLAFVVGLLVIFAGIVSSAAIVNAFHGYLQPLLATPRAMTILFVYAVLSALAVWGIAQSVAAAGIVTVIEVGGLLLVLAFAVPEARLDGEALRGVADALEPAAMFGVLAGAVLAFYAFLGFEDMVNVAEEVVDVERTLPRGILVTLGITTLLYAAVASSAVLVLPPAALADLGDPLARVYEAAGGPWPRMINLIAVIAVVNGALIQLIMASRVVYGLARQGALPPALGHVWERTQTPVAATGLVALVAAGFALWLPLERLAQVASVTALCVFALVNLSLIALRRREAAPRGAWRAPAWAPWAGVLAAGGLLAFELWRALG